MPFSKKVSKDLRKFLFLKPEREIAINMFNYWFTRIKGTVDFERTLYSEMFIHKMI